MSFLFFHRQTTQLQLVHQGHFIHRFQESGAQEAMDFDGCANNLMSDFLILCRNRFVAHGCSSFVLFVSLVVVSAAFFQSLWPTIYRTTLTSSFGDNFDAGS
jgi:hypothetical protein